MKLTPQDIIGLVGILPTPATPDAESWRTENSVNLEEAERMTDLVVKSGVEILMSNGTFGECATLTEQEHFAFNEVVIATIRKRVPFFAGIGTLNTRDTIRRGRALMEAGADGLFIARPMWLALDQVQIVRFYKDIAEALPGVALIVYDNPHAFKGKISQEAYVALCAIPEVIAAKHVGGPSCLSDALAVDHNCRILPLMTDWCRVAQLHPSLMKASWSGHVACGPAAQVALSKAIQNGDWDAAEAISERCQWAESAMVVGGDIKKFMDYSIQIGHRRFNAAGFIDAGPPRPPYIGLPDEYRDGGDETGRRWAALHKEFVEREAPKFPALTT